MRLLLSRLQGCLHLYVWDGKASKDSEIARSLRCMTLCTLSKYRNESCCGCNAKVAKHIEFLSAQERAAIADRSHHDSAITPSLIIMCSPFSPSPFPTEGVGIWFEQSHTRLLGGDATSRPLWELWSILCTTIGRA